MQAREMRDILQHASNTGQYCGETDNRVEKSNGLRELCGSYTPTNDSTD